MPLPLITVVLSPSLNCALVRSFNSLANFTSNLPLFAFTPILLSDSLVLSAPPTISSFWFNFLLMTSSVPLSPANCNPSSSVATDSLFTVKRSLGAVPFKPAGPWVVLRLTGFAPSFPFNVMEPSLPLIATEEPSLPLTLTDESFPFMPPASFWPSSKSSFRSTLNGFAAEPSPSTTVFLPEAIAVFSGCGILALIL